MAFIKDAGVAGGITPTTTANYTAPYPSLADAFARGVINSFTPQDVEDSIDIPTSDNIVSPSVLNDSVLDNINNNADQYSSLNTYDEYLKFLQKGADIGLFSTAQNVVDEAQRDRLFQSLEADKERAWYEDLAGSSYQRQVADLEAAGLNPILGWAKGFGGADSAHTAVPSGRATNLAAMAPSLTDYINAGANLINSASNILQYFVPKLSSSNSKNISNITSNSNSINKNYNWMFRGH